MKENRTKPICTEHQLAQRAESRGNKKIRIFLGNYFMQCIEY